MKQEKIYMKLGILILFLILFTSFISAFSVGSRYSKNYPLIISEGETKEVKLILKSKEDVTVIANIEKGSDLSKITDTSNEYFIPSGGITQVNITVDIPKNFNKLNDTVEISFLSAEEGEGMIGIQTGVRKKIPIEIAPKLSPEPKFIYIVPIVIALIVILLVVIIILLKRKKNKRKK